MAAAVSDTPFASSSSSQAWRAYKWSFAHSYSPSNANHQLGFCSSSTWRKISQKRFRYQYQNPSTETRAGNKKCSILEVAHNLILLELSGLRNSWAVNGFGSRKEGEKEPYLCGVWIWFLVAPSGQFKAGWRMRVLSLKLGVIRRLCGSWAIRKSYNCLQNKLRWKIGDFGAWFYWINIQRCLGACFGSKHLGFVQKLRNYIGIFRFFNINEVDFIFWMIYSSHLLRIEMNERLKLKFNHLEFYNRGNFLIVYIFYI